MRLASTDHLRKNIEFLLSRIDGSNPFLDPWPHLSIENILKDDFYDELVASLPKPSEMSGNFRRTDTLKHSKIETLENTIWHPFLIELRKSELKSLLLHKFSSYLEEYLRLPIHKIIEDSYFYVSELMVGNQHYKMNRHVDLDECILYTSLFLPTSSQQESATRGIDLYRRLKEAPKLPKVLTPESIDRHGDGDFEIAKTLPYKRNYAFAMPHGPEGWHGVRPHPSPHYRWQLRIVISYPRAMDLVFGKANIGDFDTQSGLPTKEFKKLVKDYQEKNDLKSKPKIKNIDLIRKFSLQIGPVSQDQAKNITQIIQGNKNYSELVKDFPLEKIDKNKMYLRICDFTEYHKSIHLFLRKELRSLVGRPLEKFIEFGVFEGESARVIKDTFGPGCYFGLDAYPYQQVEGVHIGDVREFVKEFDFPVDVAWNDISSWYGSPRSRLACFHWVVKNLRPGGIYIEESLNALPKDLDLSAFELVRILPFNTVFKKRENKSP